MKYHTLYVPSDLWESIVEGSKLQLGMKPAQFALHLLRGNAVSTPKAVPEKIKKIKGRSGVRVLFYNPETKTAEWIYKKENKKDYDFIFLFIQIKNLQAKYGDLCQSGPEEPITEELSDLAHEFHIYRFVELPKSLERKPPAPKDFTEFDEHQKKIQEEYERRSKGRSNHNDIG